MPIFIIVLQSALQLTKDLQSEGDYVTARKYIRLAIRVAWNTQWRARRQKKIDRLMLKIDQLQIDHEKTCTECRID